MRGEASAHGAPSGVSCCGLRRRCRLGRQRITFAAAALALCSFGLLAASGGNGKKDIQVSLVRPDDPQDFDAKGTLRIREKGNSSSFEV